MQTVKVDPVDKALFYIFRYLAFVGFTTYDYDYKKKKLVHRIIGVIYCAFLDFLILLSSEHFLLYVGVYLNHEIFFKRRVASYWNSARLGSHYLVIVINRIKNWTKRRHLKEIFGELNKIRLIDLADISQNYPEIRDEIKKTLRLKFICSCSIILSSILTMIYQSKGGNFWDYLWAAIVGVYMNLMVSVENQINFGMLYGVYLFKILNCHLSSIVQEINVLIETDAMHILERKTDFLCYELSRIGRIHSSILQLVIEFKSCFQVHILCILLQLMISQFYYIYLFCVLITDETFADVNLHIFFTIVSIFTVFLNLWLLVHICGDVIDACNESGEILGSLSTNIVLNKHLERRVQILTFQCVQEKMNLSIYGFFDLEWATGFALTNTSLEFLIVIIQFDYQKFLNA